MKFTAALTALAAALALLVCAANALADGPGPTGPRLAPIIHRGANLALPSQSKPVPLVIALHGSSMSPAMMEQTSHLDQVADRQGFVVAYLGSQTPTSSAWTPGNMSTNLSYISQEIRSLTASENIDPSRVYVTGFSAGATMSFYVGCALSSQVAAIAPVSGWMQKGQPCRLAKPESMMLIIGTNDVIPVTGTANLMSASGMASTWGGLDGCGPASSNSTAGSVQATRWNSCNDTSGVALDVINGGHHVWPSGGQLDAATTVWSFFASHPAGSPSRVTELLYSVGVHHQGAKRWVRISLSSGESSVSVAVRVRSHGHGVTSRTFSFGRGSHVLTVSIPAGAKAGRDSITLVFRDSYGRATTIVRTIKVPSQGKAKAHH